MANETIDNWRSQLAVTTPTSQCLIPVKDPGGANATGATTRDELINASDAVTTSQSGEIAAVSEKTTPVAADVILIEDSADSNAKKRIQVGNLPQTGDAVLVNAVARSDANFSNTTPAAPAGEVNVKWQADSSAPDNISASVQAASESQRGVVERATQAETDAGTDDERYVTPLKLATYSGLGTGDVTAAANIADNRVVRGDGGAKGVQQSSVTIDDNDDVTGVRDLTATRYVTGLIPEQTESGTSFTVTQSMAGNVVRCTSASDVTVTLNSGLTLGTFIVFIQGGAGRLTFAAGTGSPVLAKPATFALQTAEEESMVVMYASGAAYQFGGDLRLVA